MKDESDDQTGIFQRLVYPALAPEADIVITGETVLDTLWYVAGSSPPATTGTSPGIAFLERRFLPLLGEIKSPIHLFPSEMFGNFLLNIDVAILSKLLFDLNKPPTTAEI